MCKELVKWWARYKAVLQISVRSLVLQSHCLDWNYLGHLNKNELVGQIHFSGCPETFCLREKAQKSNEPERRGILLGEFLWTEKFYIRIEDEQKSIV